MENIQHKYIAAWDEFTHTPIDQRQVHQQKAVELHAPETAVFLTIDRRWVCYDELTSDDNKQQFLKVYKKMFKEVSI